MVLHLMHVHKFYCWLVNGVKILLFLVCAVYQDIMVIGTKDILILGEEPTDELDDTTAKADAEYSVNITKSRNKIYLNLHYNTVNSFLYANGLKTYQIKANDSEIKPFPLSITRKNWNEWKSAPFLLVMRLLMSVRSEIFINI